MKTCHWSSIIALAGTIFVAQSATGAEPPSKKDLTIGKWELQVAKSHVCNAGARKSAREITDSGWGLVTTHWTGIDAKGAPIDTWYVYKLDGQKYPSDIGKPTDVAISWKQTSPSRIEFIDWAKDGKKLADNVREVSADGQTMTQTTTPATADGKAPCVDTQVFARQ